MTESRTKAGRRGGGFNGWWLGSAMFVLAVLVAAVLVVVLGGGSGSAPAPGTSTGTASGPTDTANSSAATSDCVGSVGNMNVPNAQAPAGVRWEIVNTIAVPWSPDLGPTIRSGASRKCYQHSPAGALLAAANLAVTTSGPGAAGVLQDQVLVGPTRDALLRAAQTQPPQAKQPGEAGAYAGYRFVSYQPDSATIDLAFSFGGKYASSTYVLNWTSGDWKLNFDPPGGLPQGHLITSLAGFVPWGAV